MVAQGVTPGSAASALFSSLVDDVAARGPAAPYQNIGNEFFQGAGKGLPGGGPELTIDGISSLGVDYNGTAPAQQIVLRVQ